MPRRLVKDKAATRDLIGIWVYSFEEWGEAQADRYLDRLEARIDEIAKDTARGNQRDDVMDGYWSVRSQRHVVFYTFTADEVRIRRVLHGQMNPVEHL